jgi:polysaccharide pyruvyl transferase WcaK-like protein
MTKKGTIKQIGLIAPYSGSNLGDGAIQEAMLQNLLKRDESVKCCGITLYPADTAKRHGIPAFPITGLVIRYFTERETLFSNGSGQSSEADKLPSPPVNQKLQNNRPLRQHKSNFWSRRIEDLRNIKNVPVLGGFLRFVVFRVREMRGIGLEIRHLLRSYRLARDLDLLVVSGSGQLNEEWGGPWGLPYALFRWAILAKLTGTPFMVVSVGTDTVKTFWARYFIRVALATACYRSYRDRGSKECFANWRFTRNDRCVADLAFSLDITPYNSSEAPTSAQPIIAVSPINYGNPEYWPTPDLDTYSNYITALTEFVHWLAQRGYRILFFRSSSGDRMALRDIKCCLKERYSNTIQNQLLEPEIHLFQDLLREVSKAEFVVASRLHGILLPHLLRKPVIAISWNRKVDAHMQDLGQSRFSIDIRRVDRNRLIDRFELLKINAAEAKATIDSCINSFQCDLNAQYDIVLRHASGKAERRI